jgi:NADPH-dependent curcumin reductase
MEMATYVPMLPIGEVMASFAVGEVIESEHQEFAKGELVSGVFGWQDYAVSAGSRGRRPVRRVGRRRSSVL